MIKGANSDKWISAFFCRCRLICHHSCIISDAFSSAIFDAARRRAGHTMQQPGVISTVKKGSLSLRCCCPRYPRSSARARFIVCFAPHTMGLCLPNVDNTAFGQINSVVFGYMQGDKIFLRYQGTFRYLSEFLNVHKQNILDQSINI